MRRRLIITTALAATATLAIAAAGPLGANAKAKHVTQLTCAFELFPQGPPQGVPPIANSFGLVACPRPLGKGLHYGSATATQTGDGRGTVAVSFKKYFDQGTISGTVAGTFAAASQTNIAYEGVVTVTGGTGRFKHVKGSGKLACTSADGGPHKSCTVRLRLRGL
ncbi:MAG TPA: hypothetical protein VNA28_14445 [Solirubrobacteraceae bacterium]|nr:hypothetical protein [Solirubrobacteraceae bacterium]